MTECHAVFLHPLAAGLVRGADDTLPDKLVHEKEDCSEETAERYLTVARLHRSQVSLYATAQDEEGEATGGDVTRDDSWDYAAKAVRAAFEKRTYREQRLFEERNAVCMTCGRVSPISTRLTFEELAALLEEC